MAHDRPYDQGFKAGGAVIVAERFLTMDDPLNLIRIVPAEGRVRCLPKILILRQP